jgi:CheY-like chemotaxis protein
MTKVLLVEDDNNLREIFDMRLQAEGYKTVTAGDGEEALVVAVKEKPDLVIADVMMPKLSGFEMVENMRAAPELANVKVVMMTALGQAEDRARGEKLGVVKYLVKSQVTLEDFVRIIREVMPPDQAGSAPVANQPDDTAQQQPNIIKPQESEASMQDDAQTPTNPTPDAGPAPAGDASVPASDPAASMNPISDAPAASPLGDVSTTTPQTTAEETSAVQDQFNNFESDPNAGAAPVGDASVTPPADANAPAADSSVPPAAVPTDVPAPTDGAAPAAPAPEAPAPEEGTNNQPPSNNNAL